MTDSAQQPRHRGAPPRSLQRALEVRHLTVKYGDAVAVDGVSLSVQRGEIYGLLGPNGAGKTSVIRALTTIVPAAGDVTLDGHPLSDRSRVRASIGVLPESNGYPVAQTARSYLRFYGQLFGLGPDEANQRARRLLDQVGLGSNPNRIGTFSRGMRQRLGLARALINEPAVLFLDEPTLGLDPAGKEEILAHLTTVAERGPTGVVLCSHLLDEVERVCDRIAIMHEGHLIADGTVDEVVSSSGVTGRLRMRVAADDVAVASDALRDSPAATSLTFDNSRPGDLDIELGAVDGARSQILRLVLDAGVEPRAFDVHGARLSDAFLTLTRAPRRAAS